MLPNRLPGKFEVLVSASILSRVNFQGLQLRDTFLILTANGLKFGYLVRELPPAELLPSLVENGVGALAIDACRKPWVNEADRLEALPASMPGKNASIGTFETRDRTQERPEDFQSSLGRWPTNVVVVHHPSCATHCSPGCIVTKLTPEAIRYYPQFKGFAELLAWFGILIQANLSR